MSLSASLYAVSLTFIQQGSGFIHQADVVEETVHQLVIAKRVGGLATNKVFLYNKKEDCGPKLASELARTTTCHHERERERDHGVT